MNTLIEDEIFAGWKSLKKKILGMSIVIKGWGCKVDNTAQVDSSKKYETKELDTMPENYTIEDYFRLAIYTDPSGWRYARAEAPCDFLKRMGIDPELLQEQAVPPSVLNLKETKKLDQYLENDLVFNNVKMLSKIIPLTPLEIKIMVFASYLSDSISQPLEDLSGRIECPSRRKLSEVMAHILCEEVSNILSAIHEDGQLFSSGLLSKNEYFHRKRLNDFFSVNENLLDIIDLPNITDEQLVDCFYKKASKPHLDLKDFEYMNEDISAALRKISSDQGGHLLIHGDPGVGKTQLAKILAMSCDKDVIEIPESMSAQHRVSCLRATSKITKDSNKSIILFDEADDALNGSDESRISRKSGEMKAELTKLLEDKSVTVIWITNEIGNMHEAAIRRFSVIIEMKEPPVEITEKRIRSQLKEVGFTLNSQWIKQVASEKNITPAVFSMGLENVSLCKDKVSNVKCQKMLTRHFNNYLNAIGSTKRIKEITKNSTRNKNLGKMNWDSSFLNTDMDLSIITKAGKHNHPVRLCLYGPPGTGKTEWAKQLAKRLKKRIIIKQASELLGMYVGESEQNIAEAFNEAEKNNAILQIDEADSFLWPRESAKQSWQISLTNQFLTSLENFNGIFIATTNHLGLTDQAVMRRFDFRVKFNFLQPEQAKRMFQSLAEFYDIELNKEVLDRMHKQTHLTPGDFAVIARRSPLLKGSIDENELMRLLLEETDYKKEKENSIGFLANPVNRLQ